MKVIQKAVIQRDGKYLIVLRSKLENLFSHHWDFPGGGIKDNEDLIEGIQREIYEETGLKSDIGKILGVYEMDLLDKGVITHKIIVYSVTSSGNDIIISDEHDEYRWATKEEILKLPVNPFILQFFKEY